VNRASMPRLALPLAALLLLGCAGGGAPASSAARAAPATLTAAERARLVKDLEETRAALLASVQGLSEAQVRFRPAPDRWSVAEVAEHIALAEERLYGVVTDKVLRGPPPPELRGRAPDDERVRRSLLDRGARRQAPEVLRPTGRFPTLGAAVGAFEKGRERTLALARSTQEDLRGHGAPHPVLQLLDGYQWLLVLSSHCARHTAQIEEIKADPAFPRP
jgi:hypothetical protein